MRAAKVKRPAAASRGMSGSAFKLEILLTPLVRSEKLCDDLLADLDAGKEVLPFSAEGMPTHEIFLQIYLIHSSL